MDGDFIMGTMELKFSGLLSFDHCKNVYMLKAEIKKAAAIIQDVPSESEIVFNKGGSIIFQVDAKDKDDYKYYKSRGFVR
jgi:hypothetical protein